MKTLFDDFRFAVRMMLKKPVFTLVALITLALGIGANTAIFSVINALLLSSLPYKESDRLVKVWVEKAPNTLSKAEFAEIRDGNKSFDDVAAYTGWSFTLTGKNEPAKLSGARTTATFFSLLGVNAALGRTFLPDEDKPDHSNVVILSHGIWESRFGSDKNVIGQSITIDGKSHLVVGVLPSEFKFPDKQFSTSSPDLVVPATLDLGNNDDFTAEYLNVVGRLRRGVAPEQARAEVVSIASNARTKLSKTQDNYGLDATVVPLQKDLVGDFSKMLFILLSAVGFVLLIACANVANLQLARTNERRGEIAIRSALGAARKRVFRQLLTESLLLSLSGGAMGVLLAVWGIHYLVSLLPSELPKINEIGLDFRVLLFSSGISILTGILFGLAPAFQSSKPDLQETLKEGGRRSTSTSGEHLRRLLVVSEIALALMVVVSAGLLVKSFWRLQQVDPGFKAENVLSLKVAPPSTTYSNGDKKRIFYDQVIKRIETLPGVKATGGIHLLPMGGGNWDPSLRVEDYPVPAGQELPSVDWRLITPGYFKAMDIRLVRGRFFTEGDNEKSQKVAIVNETLAKRYWPNEDPIGKRIKGGFEGKEWVPIVGVVGDVKEQRLDTPTHLEMYRPYSQAPFVSSMVLMVRSVEDYSPVNLAAAIRSEIWAIDRDVPVADIQPLSQVVSQSVLARRSTMLLFTIFAIVALVLGTIGIYGVMAYRVSQRTHEIGIRIALGAQTKDVLKMILGQGMLLVLTGVSLGIIGALGLTRLMSSLLFGVSPRDVFTFASVALLLIIVALIACFIPARKATKVDPMNALRYE